LTGTCTNGEVVVFSPVFTATPKIYLSYAEDPGANDNTFYTGGASNTFTCGGVAGKNIDYIAVGAKSN